jgi:two-component system response regulator PilR (NtrC family)
MSKERILVVDDELSMRQFLKILLTKDGYDVEVASNGQEALDILNTGSFSVILMDYNMPEAIDGLDLLNEFIQRTSSTQIVVITAFASTEQAIKAIELGAADYVSKPFNVAEIRDIVKKCILNLEEKQEKQQKVSVSKAEKKRSKVLSKNSAAKIVSESKQMKNILEVAKQIAPTDSTVLLTGDSGTGKEVLAKYIHACSERTDHPWYPINCGAIPETLLESELFGHEKGSFTGAHQLKKGYFEVAGEGTLFLDEIGELSENMQVKLLRVLQERNFTRVGGTEKIQTDVRLIAATNRDLKERIEKGLFREDLFFRLNVLEIYIPPLNQRRDDILPLAQMFLEEFGARSGKEFMFSDEMISFLKTYDFPGNVRELKNIVERGTVFAKNGVVDHKSFTTSREISGKIAENGEIDLNGPVSLDEILEEVERKYISKALEKTENNRQETAKMLNITERSLRYRITKLNIKG